MKFSRLAWFAALLLTLAPACSGGNQGSGERAATNPIDFPLFPGAEVLSAHAWRQTISSRPGAADSAVFTQGAGTYDGHDVVAGTQALTPSLETWLSDLDVHPPNGYRPVPSGNGVEAVRSHTRELGVDFALFEGVEGGKRHGVAVLTVDPQALDAKAGPMLGMIEKFRLLPKMLRDSIDVQAKKETGFTVTELTNPDTPIGAAIASLDRLRDFGGRGVVLVDAVKE